MRPTAIRKMEKSSIEKELQKMEAELVEISENIRMGKEKDVRKSLKIKRNIARMLTVLKEMSLTS